MNVRCKFKCRRIEDTVGSAAKEVTFETQYDPGLPEDVRFTKATPWGKLMVSIDNPAALEHLEVGRDYYLDLTPCA
jgi:hypothetical protein